MVEIKPGQAPIEPRGFRLNIKTVETSVITAEQKAAFDWYREQLKTLEEQKVKETNVTNGKDWLVTLTPKGEVQKIESTKGFFKIEGRHPGPEWDQPMIVQSTESAETGEGELIRLSGIVIRIKDQADRTLVVIANEPGADIVEADGKELHPQVRTPVQASVAKLKLLEAGEESKDPVLFRLLTGLGKRSLRDAIESVELSKVATDANRLESNVYYGAISVQGEEATRLEELTGGKFLSREQLKVLPVNGHTNIALSVTS